MDITQISQAVLPLIAIFVVFYLLMVLPQRKQAKQRQAMLAGLKAGDEVETVGRVYGKVVETSGNTLILNVSAGSDETKIKVSVEAVARVITNDQPVTK